MADLKLSLACGTYDRTDALRTGAVKPEGIELTYVAIDSPPILFRRMLEEHEFDVAEMGVSQTLSNRPGEAFPFVGIPAFPSRMFRHSYIFVNTKSGIKSPKDLEGKRIAALNYRSAASIWIRGLLENDYGVDLKTIHWFAENSAGGNPVPKLVTNIGMKIDAVAEGQHLVDMLASGEVDAWLAANKPTNYGTHPDIQRLFPNHREIEREYFKTTGIFPIMHGLAIKKELAEKEPWVVDSIYKAFDEAKAHCFRGMRHDGALKFSYPWSNADLEEMEEIFGADAWPYGLEVNRKTLETFRTYLIQQGFLADPVALEEVFAPVSAG